VRFFKVEKLFLEPEALAIATEASVAFDDPMAGNDEGDRVRPVCVTHGTESSGMTDRPGNVLV